MREWSYPYWTVCICGRIYLVHSSETWRFIIDLLRKSALARGAGDWIGTAAREIVPVVRRMREILLASPRLFADETTMRLLDPGRGQVKKGFAWAIARDDRSWAGRDPPAVVFHYAPGRGK